MMGQRIQMVSGDEYDALTRAKRFFHWRPGQRAEIKRAFRRRERHEAKAIRRDSLGTERPSEGTAVVSDSGWST